MAPLLLAAAFALDPWGQTAAGAEGTPLGAPEVALRHGLLSVRANEVPLAELLRAIGEEAGFRVIIKGDLSDPVTSSFADVPVDEALRRLLQNANSVLIHAPAPGGGAGRLVELRAWPGHGDAAASAAAVVRAIQLNKGELAGRTPLVNPNDDRRDRLRAVRKLASRSSPGAAKDLALALSEDEDPAVRRVAAIALGKLRLPEAKAALVAALSDEDTQVRRRAVQGLGKTWGKEAVEPLGLALAADPEPSVRRQAAKRLGRIFSDAAYRALDAARLDTDDSVRRAVLAGLARLEKM